MRAFLGIPVPGDVSGDLVEHRRPLEEFEGAKPVAPENFHVTIKFLEEINRTQKRELDSGLQRNLPPVGPLELNISGFGAFPNPSYPRVVWAGVSPRDPLAEVYQAAEETAQHIDVEPDERDYVPHVTLLRLKNPEPHRKKVIDWLKSDEPEDLSFPAPRLVLYESQLEEGGPIYKELEAWPL